MNTANEQIEPDQLSWETVSGKSGLTPHQAASFHRHVTHDSKMKGFELKVAYEEENVEKAIAFCKDFLDELLMWDSCASFGRYKEVTIPADMAVPMNLTMPVEKWKDDNSCHIAFRPFETGY